MNRIVAIVLVAFVLASCSSGGSTAPTVDVANPCDYICLGTLDTSWGRIAVGTGWDEDAGLLDGYLAAWLVHQGESTRTKLTTDNVDRVGVPHLVSWGDRAAIIATGSCDRCRMSLWITSDGRAWDGPRAFSLPGESPAHLSVTSWGSRLVILGEQVPDNRRFASVWTSTDGERWQLGPRPAEWDDAIEAWCRFPVQETTVAVMTAALATRRRFGVSYWDAAVIEAGRALGCAVVLSEDLSPETDHDGVRVENPFAD